MVKSYGLYYYVLDYLLIGRIMNRQANKFVQNGLSSIHYHVSSGFTLLLLGLILHLVHSVLLFLLFIFFFIYILLNSYLRFKI